MQDHQSQIKQKQDFLRNQILQGGLDPDTFMDYMGTVKNEGQNIQLTNWSMEELNKVVNDFKQQINIDRDTYQKVKQSQVRQSQQILSKIIRSTLKKQKVHYEKGLWDYQINNEHECKAVNKSFQFNPKIKPKAHVLSWEVRSHGGFFLGIGATKQLWIKIQTNFTQKPLQRNNSDFQWYRNALAKFHPGSYIPPLAQLRAIQPQDKKGLQQRTKLIQQFLNSVIQYEYLIQSTISKIFLTQYDHNRLTNYKNKQRNTLSTKNVGRIQTLSGKFQIQLSQRIQKFIKNSSSFGKVAQQTYVDIQSQINKILSDLQSLSKHILNISNSCGVLNQKYTKICGLNEIKSSSMQSIMLYLNNLFSNIGKNIKQQIGVVKEFSDQFVRYSIRSWQQFMLHDKKYQKQLQNYLYFKTELVKKKQRFINDVSKWQLESQKQFEKVSKMNMAMMDKEEIFLMMFPRDNKAQQELRIWIAYLNKVYEQSFKTLLKEEENQLKEKFNSYIDHAAKVTQENNNATKQFKEIIAGA